MSAGKPQGSGAQCLTKVSLIAGAPAVVPGKGAGVEVSLGRTAHCRQQRDGVQVEILAFLIADAPSSEA